MPKGIDANAPILRVPADLRDIAVDIARALNLMPEYSNVDDDNITLAQTVAEVFFPIDFIASRIAGAHYELKRVKDDSIVWCSGRSGAAQKITQILTRPNCIQTLPEFIYSHFFYRAADGNVFMRAAMSTDAYTAKTPKWRYCDNFWSIPQSLINIETDETVPLFGVCDIDEVIKGYTIGKDSRVIPAWQVWHDRDVITNVGVGKGSLLMSPSRLEPLRKLISTLKKVYDARNVIYGRCGALGILTNKAQDVTGHQALKKGEKEEILRQYTDTYGVEGGKSPILITDANLAFFRTGMSINELQPFEETLLDAIVIAGQFGIPDVLVPRKDHSTFNNQATAEKAVYSSVIIPMAKQFCNEFTQFLGIEEAGYYIDCNFDHVDCLQTGRKEAEEVNRMVNERCRQQFMDGLISFNNWMGQIHESALDGDVFSKTRMEMSDDELRFIARVIDNRNINANPQDENGEDNEESAGADESE